MKEAEAKAWVADRFGVEATDRLDRFLAMVVAENENQNLIAPSTIEAIWSRHAVDSAQLLALASKPSMWLDVGTGGGFPGMVIALLGDFPVTMVEPRRRRSDFLRGCVAALGVTARARVEAIRVEAFKAKADIISARAVASIEKLLQATAHCATSKTRWILPRGRLDFAQFALIRHQRGKVFHVEHSLTDPNSTILVIENAQ